jgi:hypothetical protein
LRFQHDTAPYPLPHLISWEWTSPYEFLTTACYTRWFLLLHYQYQV